MVEFLYLVDKEDKVLGKVEREEAHSKGLLHRAGVVLVFNQKEEIFLTHRSPLKKIFPDCFDCACSFHVKYGEPYEKEAKRELNEETKIQEPIEYLGKFLLDKEPDHLIVAVYKANTNSNIVLDPEEAASGKFYPFEQADRIISTEKTTHWLPKAWKIYKNSKE